MNIVVIRCMYLCLAGWFVSACSEKEFDPQNPDKSYKIALEPYDDKNYDIALNKLGEFKSRFPYSHFAIEAELLIAHSQFALGRYLEAGESYKQFTALHPSHPQRSLALYRVGECFWMNAPTETDREQEFTEEALKAWKQLLSQPGLQQDEYTEKASVLIKEGELRMAQSEAHIVAFYCKKDLWHACSFRAKALAAKYPHLKEIAFEANERALFALQKLLAHYDELKPDHDLMVQHYSKADLALEIQRLFSLVAEPQLP